MTTVPRSFGLTWLRRLGFVLALPLLVVALHAQPTGSLQGVVTDSNGQAFIQGAIVRLDGTSLETTTDRTGNYSFPTVPAGQYSMTVSYLGLDSAKANVAVASGQRVSRDVTL